MYEFQFFSILYTPKVCNLPKWFVAINEPVYIYDANANENYYLLKNDQNTVLALYQASDTTGSVPREQYEYSSYGITNILDQNGLVKTFDHDLNVNTPEVKKVKSDFSNPFGYQGMWRDEHTGLYHTHYRLYDPQHVRWLTPDPAGYRDGQNLYRFYAGPNGVDPLGLMDEDSVRHAVTNAITTKGKVLSRLARIKAGDDEALTAEYIAKTQSMYKSYLVQRNLANSQIKAYMENSSYFSGSSYDWYQAAESKLGEIAEVGQISAKGELAHVKSMSNLISSNLETIGTLRTVAQYSGYAGNAILIGTGIGGLGLVATRIGYIAFKTGGRIGVNYALKEGGLFAAKTVGGIAAYMAVDAGAQALATDEAKPYVSSQLLILGSLIGLKYIQSAFTQEINLIKYAKNIKGFALAYANMVTGKPMGVSVAIDTKTGKIYYGESGNISSNINKSLQDVMPNPSLEAHWAVANCAEFNAANNALNAGAKMKNLFIYTIIRKNKAPFCRCKNCQITVKDAIIFSDN